MRGKNAIKKTRDHNWDMDRMQFQKEQGNISSQNGYVNMGTKTADVQEAMGSKKGDDLTTSTNNIAKLYNKGQEKTEKEKNG